MLLELRSSSNIRGSRIDVGWLWRAVGARPALRLLRRRWGYPRHPRDGLEVVDLADLFRTVSEPWAFIGQARYFVPNSRAEGGLRQATVSLYFRAEDPVIPARVRIAYYDVAAGAPLEQLVDSVTGVEHTSLDPGPWETVDSWEIFATSGGAPAIPAGEIVVLRGHADQDQADRFEWHPAGGPAVAVEFDESDALRTSLAEGTPDAGTLEWDVARTSSAPGLTAAWPSEAIAAEHVRGIRLEEVHDADTDEWVRRIELADADLTGSTTYYYAVFLMDPALPDGYRSERPWKTHAAATGRFGMQERLYDYLPSVHRRWDEPDPTDVGRGRLRAYLQVFGAALDQLRGLADGLRQRHDVHEVRADALPHLARWIGWEHDRTSTVVAQRNDILFAPEIYGSLGTLPNLRALVNRVTGWQCELKEFVHNVFLTNAPEEFHFWDLWERSYDGVAWSEPASLMMSEHFEARPAGVLAGGTAWLFWQSERSGRREIWLRRLGIDAEPRRAAPDAEAPDLSYADQEPAVIAEGALARLFWSSNREGSWDIWTRVYDGVPGEAAERLTDHPAVDRHPAAVRDNAGRTWLFWQSPRRGPTDIWARVHDGAEWGAPARITTAPLRDEMPAAVLDATGHIWLFWSADEGDRRNLHYQVFDGVSWGPRLRFTEGYHRDEAPAAVMRGSELWVVWHSNRGIRWDLWARVYDGTTWSEPFAQTAHAEAEKDPMLFLDGGGVVRLVWRSQRRAPLYRSRTLDVADATALAQLGTLQDRAHYTYDTGTENHDWYARETIGLYLTPDVDDTAVIERGIQRVSGFVAPFRPVPVRFVWLPTPSAQEEHVASGAVVEDEWDDEVA